MSARLDEEILLVSRGWSFSWKIENKLEKCAENCLSFTRILGPLQFDLEFGFLSGTRGILNNEISKVIVCDGWWSKYKYCLIDTELMDIEKIVSVYCVMLEL